MAKAEETSQQTEQKEVVQKPHPRVRKKAIHKLSLITKVILGFALTSACTAVITVGAIVAVWSSYFVNYAAGNIETIAETTANRIGESYFRNPSLEVASSSPVRQLMESYPDMGIKVLDTNGQTVIDSLEGMDPESDYYKEPSEATQIALADIKSGETVLGSVRIWMYGSESLMSSVDKEFQRYTYFALIVSGAIAILVSCFVGFIFARQILSPVKKILATATKLSDGEYSARTQMVGSDEISKLGEMIDDMADSFEADRQLERRLTSDVAHELRTPLMAIQATVEAMVDGIYEPDEERLVQVDTEVKRLSRLVDALLRLSRLENRSQPMKEEVTDIGELVEGIMISHQVFIEDSGLQVTCDVEPNVKAVCDSDMIRQAIANLVSNAVSYTSEGGRIDLKVFCKDNMAAISVGDTGIGLSPEEAKMVFSRFWRADSGRARESGGLGIGLSVVKEIVDRHHGKVFAEGEKGVGSTFTIMLPLYDEESSVNQARSALRAFEKRQK